MDARELSQRLSQNALSVARHLFPNGKQDGKREYAIGSLAGDAGKSLKICISGSKAGLWSDFSTNEKGDLLDLWMQARRISLREALDEAASFLGIVRPSFQPLERKEYKKALKPSCQVPKAHVHYYLSQIRHLKPETIQAFQIGEDIETAIFPYIRDGELIHWKKTRYYQDGGLWKKEIKATSSGTPPSLFGWQALDKTFPNTRTVCLTEGELDAMSLHQLGFPALSVPFGGGAGQKQNWIDYEFERMQAFDEIVLVMDNDGPGQEAAEEISKRLGRHRCRIVDLGYKDANAALQAGVTVEQIQVAIQQGRYICPDQLKNAGDFAEQVEKLYSADSNEGQARFDRLPWYKTHQDIRLELEQLTVWTGFNGHGKSELLLQVMVDLMHQGHGVCIASLEVPPVKLIGRHLLPQLTAMGEPSPAYRLAVYQWLSERLWLFNLVGTAKADQLLETFAYARQRYGVTHFVIDSLLKIGLDEDDYNGQKAFMERLTDFKNEHGCHIHLVAHARKAQNEDQSPGKLDIRGAGAITDLADNVFSVWRNKPKETALSGNPEQGEKIDFKGKKLLASEVIKMPDTYLRCLKQREEGKEPCFALWFNRESRQFIESEQGKPRRYIDFSIHNNQNSQ